MGVSSSSIRNYHVGQPYFLDDANTSLKVTVCPASSVVDGEKYTLFQFEKQNGKLGEAGERYIEVLKTTRHPYVLKYLALFSNVAHETVVTEHVVPLDVAVEKQEKEEICAGLRNVLEALIFLHERSSICHNGISVSSIFVSDNGEWKLAAFENSSKVLRLSKQSFDSDVSGFCEFALSVLEYLKDESDTTKSFMKRLEKESTIEDKEGSSLKAILDDPFFKFPYLEALDGLQNLALKSVAEKKELFRILPDVLHGLTPYVVCHRFIPLMFTHMVLTDPIANDTFMPYLFASGNDFSIDSGVQPLVDRNHFVKYALPKILSLFELRDFTVRLTIMKYLPYYVDCIDKEILQEEVLPELLTGLKDTNDILVRETFLALASIVDILGGSSVVGGESHTYFYDRNPDFSRAKREGEIPSSANVSDVIKQKVSNKNEEAEERKRKRLEREKQREEQKKIRELRKIEREAAKAKKEQERSLEDDLEPSLVEAQPARNEVSTLQQDLISTSVNLENSEHGGCDSDDISDAEWEGFEVMSNSSDIEVTDQTELTSPVTGYNGNEGDHNIELPPLQESNRQTQVLSSFEENDHEIMEYINSQIAEGVSLTQKDEEKQRTERASEVTLGTAHQTPTIPRRNSGDKTLKDTSQGVRTQTENKPKAMTLDLKAEDPQKQGMSLKSKESKPKESKPKESVDKTSVKNDKKNLDLSKKKESELGNEFDIKIDKNKFTMEPDYFADMTPTFGSKLSVSPASVIVEKKVEVSSKFNMDINIEDASGWDDDEWGNDEDPF